MGKQSFSVDTIFINRPTIADYNYLDTDVKIFVDTVIKDIGKSNHILRINDRDVLPKQNNFWMLSWSDVIELRNAIRDMDMPLVIEMIYSVSKNNFLKLDVFNCFAVYKWINEQLIEISTIEKQELQSEPTSDEKNAGVDQLEQFEYAVALDSLSKGDLLEEDKILQKPYGVIFRKLCLNKVKADIQRNYMENVSRKNQRSVY